MNPMKRLIVEGGHPLNGVYRPAGNANAAMALMAASLLTDQPVTLRNVPNAANVQAMQTLATTLGTTITTADDGALILQTGQIQRRVLSSDETGGLVATLLYLAPMLVQRQHIRLELDFPLVRVRTHLEALADLGIGITNTSGGIDCAATPWEHKDIQLTQASVTATQMALMLAARLGRETVIHNAAGEPHVQTLAHVLTQMGARVEGIGSNVLRVFGASTLRGASIAVPPDHVEVASVAALAALTGGRVQITPVQRADLRMIVKTYARLGVQLDSDEDALFIPKHDKIALSARPQDQDLEVETAPWPGFPSDLVAIATLIATQARGTTLIHEKLFNNRLLFVDKLKAMGAQIVLCDPHRAIVVGASPLIGGYMDTPDVRTGLGMLCAALTARGTSTIDNAQVLAQSFDNVVAKLQAVGARITVE
jgi:UDP-N-acetylglucosamine 1-carboxyvinyltransferase